MHLIIKHTSESLTINENCNQHVRNDFETHFKKWFGLFLSSENKRQLWVPVGFAHGFLVTSEFAEVLYKTTDYWHQKYERCLIWNDSTVGIDWPVDGKPIISPKDLSGMCLSEADVFN